MSMPTASPPDHASLAQDFASAMDWWRDAGVDCDFSDDATDWLGAAPSETPAAPAAAPAAKPAANSAPDSAEKKPEIARILPETGVPEDLAAFQQWWLEEPALDAIGPRGRVSARGAHGSKLMVLVLDPEESDSEQLLSGAQGNLLRKILTATGIAEEDVYFASVLPRRTPMAGASELLTMGFAEVLQLHIKLAAPQHVAALGSSILPLLAHGATEETTKEAGSLEEINHEGRTTPLFVAESLEGLMGSPALKARFWRRWVKWTERLN